MRYLLFIFIITSMVVSCQITDENAPRPDEAFVKYYGELTSYEAKDIEIVYDETGEIAEGLLVLGTIVSEFGDTDFFILRTDLEGNLIDTASFELRNDIPDDSDSSSPNIQDFPEIRSEDFSGQIQRLNDGTFAFVGTSSFTQNSADISDFRIARLAILTDGLELVSDTFFTVNNYGLDFEANDVIQLSDQNLLVSGARQFNRGGGITDFDNFYVKLSLDGQVIYSIAQGVSGDNEDDVLIRSFEKSNGNIALIGYSNSPSLLGENNGNNGTNVYYLESDANGTPVNFAAYGFENPDPAISTIYNEQVNNVVQTASGYSIVGTSITSQNQRFSFLMNLSNNGIYLSGNSHDSSAYNSNNTVLQTNGYGVTQALNKDIIMVGQYQSFVSGTLSRGGEGMFVKFDQSARPIVGAESFFGLSDGSDSIVDAVTLPDGKVVAVANIDFGGGVRLISIIKMNDDGSLD